MIETIKTILVPLLIISSLYFAKKASKKKSKKDDNGNSVHQLSLMYGVGGIISVGISLLISIAILFSENEIEYSNIIPVILMFIVPGIILCLMTWMNKITLSDNKITQRNLWGKIRIINLNEIESVKFNKISLYLNISDSHTTVKCHEHLIDFERIITEISKKTELTKSQMGFIE
ncbi:hypothetical protein [Wenyingzhuangia sp. IMCC45574]